MHSLITFIDCCGPFGFPYDDCGRRNSVVSSKLPTVVTDGDVAGTGVERMSTRDAWTGIF